VAKFDGVASNRKWSSVGIILSEKLPHYPSLENIFKLGCFKSISSYHQP